MLSAPWPLLPAMLPFHEIVSHAFVQKVGDDGLVTRENGTAPFRLVEWRPGDSIIMERVADYYGGSPYVPPVGPAKVAPADLQGDAGQCLARGGAAGGGCRYHQRAAGVGAAAGAGEPAGAGGNDQRDADELHCHQRGQAAVQRSARAPGAEPCGDRKLIIARLLNGNATALNGVLSPDVFAFAGDLPEYAYDPARAKALLAEAGASALKLTIDSDGASKEIAEAITTFYARVGIQANVQVWEQAVIAPIWRDAQRRRERDMFLTSWGNATLDPSDIMMPAIRSGGRGNYTGYSNAEVDRLLDAADVEIDQAKRKTSYGRVQQLVNAEAPWVFLWLPQDIYGVSNRVHGWKPRPDSKMNMFRATVD